MRGYLNKYTNVAKGYGARWFVLRNGILSCELAFFLINVRCLIHTLDYRHQVDEGVASRGSIAMASAVLKYHPHSAGDRLRFEVHSNPSRSGPSSSQQKWYIRGNQASEVSRWVQAIQKNIEFHRGDLPSSNHGHSSEYDGRSLRSIATTFRSSMSSASPFRRSSPNVQKASPASSITDSREEMWDSGLGDSSRISIGPSGLPGSTPPDETDADEDDYSMDSRSQYGKPPHDTSFSLQGNAAVAQAELTAQLISSLRQPPTSPKDLAELKAALVESADKSQQMFNEYVRMAQEREEWWKERLDREVKRGAAWEESLQVVVKEGEVLENELKSRFRQRSSRIEGTSTEGGTTTPRRRISLAPGSSMFTTISSLAASRPDSMPSGLPVSPPPPDSGSPLDSRPLQSPPPTSTDFGDTTDEEDEFFDAIESNSLPNVIVPSAFVAPPEVKPSIERTLQMEQYAGYYKLRTRLPIEKDTRPPTSLWSVLKHSIGKDLTKISFPVFFNEPTSMLQRMVSLVTTSIGYQLTFSS